MTSIPSETEMLSKSLSLFVEKDHLRWLDLADEDVLLKGLQAGVRASHDQAVVSVLEDSWSFITDPRVEKRLEKVFGSSKEDIEIAMRLCRNARGLVATALGAVAAKDALSHEDARQRLAKWWCEAARHLTREAGTEIPAVPSLSSVQDPASLTEQLSEKLSSCRWPFGTLRYWTLYWLELQSHVATRGLSVWFACRDKNEFNKEYGFLAQLFLDVLKGTGEELVEHPEIALFPFGSQLKGSLDLSWELSRSLVCWNIKLNDQSDRALEPLDGDSLSGAAARGFWFARHGKVPDDGVIVLARLAAPGSPGHGYLLREVTGVEAKVQAIAADGRFDTIVVADKVNAQEAVTALGKSSSIRVIDLSTNKEWRWTEGQGWDARDYPAPAASSNTAPVAD
jgi:hypothetical protein